VLIVARLTPWYYHLEVVSQVKIQKNAGREKLMKLIWKLRLMKDTRGQDLIEYAL